MEPVGGLGKNRSVDWWEQVWCVNGAAICNKFFPEFLALKENRKMGDGNKARFCLKLWVNRVCLYADDLIPYGRTYMKGEMCRPDAGVRLFRWLGRAWDPKHKG